MSKKDTSTARPDTSWMTPKTPVFEPFGKTETKPASLFGGSQTDPFEGLFSQSQAPTQKAPQSLPLDQVTLQQSLLTNGNAAPEFKIPSWLQDGTDPNTAEGAKSLATYLNVPEQMSPFLKLDQYGVLPGTNLSAADYQAIGAGKTIQPQIESQLQIQRMMEGGPLAGTQPLDGKWLQMLHEKLNPGAAPSAPLAALAGPFTGSAAGALQDLLPTGPQGLLQTIPEPMFDPYSLANPWQGQGWYA